MTQLQVKAKSGLHTGAVWHLTKSLVKIGASVQSDIFLCDPEIPDTLICISRYGRRYVIENSADSTRLARSDGPMEDNTLYPGQTLIIDFRHIQLECSIFNNTEGLGARLGDSSSRLFHMMLRFLRGLGARAIIMILFMCGLLMTSLILFFGTAGVAKTQASILRDSTIPASVKDPTPIEAAMVQNLLKDLEVFANRLGTNNISVSSGPGQVELTASLSRSQGLEFERELAKYARDYGAFVELRASLELTEEQQKVDQIQVAEVIFGLAPAVVLTDGTTLFEGGEYNGLQIGKISPQGMEIRGEATYEVAL